MPTIKDIAKAAGVSAASVSRVINNGPKVGSETRKKIKKIMREMGYYPNANAQAINQLSGLSIGIVVEDLVDPFFAVMAHGIEKIAAAKKAQIFMNSGASEASSEMQAITTLLEHRYQAMVVHSSALDDKTIIGLANKNPGFVLINRHIPEIEKQCVWLDDEAGGRLMAEYILERGHRNIAVISAEKTFNNTNKRVEGIKNALADHDVRLSNESIEYSEKTYEGGQLAIQNLLASGRPYTAVLAYNDAMAIGAISMLESQGFRVPEDVSVIGFDDLILANCIRPKLTTVNNRIEDMAIRATEIALSPNTPNKLSVSKHNKFLPFLVTRQSVKCL
jgi:LacI family transcriptional regulator